MSNEPFFTFSNQASQGSSKPKSLGCLTCRLDKNIKTPRMPCFGKGRMGVMLIGEAPGLNEDSWGRPFTGNAGKRLRQELHNLGINMDKDCFLENACACCLSKKETPNPKQIESCRSRLIKSIREKEPRVIVLLGKAPLDSVVGNYWKRGVESVSKWRGFHIPLHGLNCWACSTFHPSYVMKEEHQESAVPTVFGRDLNAAFKLRDIPLPEKIDVSKRVRILDADGAVAHMERLLRKQPKLLAFDFETTGLKPHAPGHDIVCCSMCHRPDQVIVFWCYREMKKAVAVRSAMKAVLESQIPKVASQMKFENSWAKIALKARVRNWNHDTMVGAHVLDNRPHVTSIKFEGFVRFGISAYDEGIERYTETRSKDGNAFNALRKMRPAELLPYCGIDSLLEYLTAVEQKKELGIEN